MKKATFFVFALLLAMAGRGQAYLADNLNGDSVVLFPLKVSGADTARTGDTLWIANGEEVQFVCKPKHDWPRVSYRNQLCEAEADLFRLSPSNPAGTENLMQNASERRHHSVGGHFFRTLTPYWIIFILLVGAGAGCFLVSRYVSDTQKALRLMMLVALALVVSVVLEVMALIYSGNIVWWCDAKRLGIWRAALRLLPLALAIASQVFVGFGYKRFLEERLQSSVSVKPVMLGVALSVPVTLVLAIIFNFVSSNDWLITLAFLGSLAVGFVWSLRKNAEEIGQGNALFYTSFMFVYTIGLIIAAILLIVVLVRLFVAIIMALFPFIAAAVGVFVLSATGGTGGGGGGSRTVYTDAKGYDHTTAMAAEEANRRYAEEDS